MAAVYHSRAALCGSLSELDLEYAEHALFPRAVHGVAHEARGERDGHHVAGQHRHPRAGEEVHPVSAGHLLQGEPTFVAATPAGIMEILRAYEVPLEGARAVVVGRSNIVGKPMALLLLAENATVTVCHSRTRDLAAVVGEADVVVAAVGRAAMVTREMVKPGAAVIDVGINRVDGKVVGDVAEDVREVAGHLTPVPGGVGPMTIASLLRNTVRAASYQAGALAFPGA